MREQRMVVLGHSGMLGHMAVAWFRARGYHVETIDTRFDIASPEAFMSAISSALPSVVINAIGLARPRSKDWSEALIVNAALPWLLRQHLSEQITLIHPSTDCVFAGDRGNYGVAEPGNAANAYGLSKALGEGVAGHANTLVIRTSVIGPELPGRSNGLLAWFLSQPEGATVPGYIDQTWNGITTLEWCKFAEETIQLPRESRPSLAQPCTPEHWTKAEMLSLFRQTWERNVVVEPVKSGITLNRTLRPTHFRKCLTDQLGELSSWYAAPREHC